MTTGLVIDWIRGNCPVQAEGMLEGRPFYFRARWEQWALSVASSTDGNPLADDAWTHSERYTPADGGEASFAAGWMSGDEARAFITGAASEYCRISRPG